MGKYMKNTKLKTKGQNPNKSTNIGIRTRTKTLAFTNTLQFDSSSEYIQLRSRRLYKASPPTSAADEMDRNPNSSSERIGRTNSEFGPEHLTRTTRESTPCSAERQSSDVISKTHGSVTKSSKHMSASLSPQFLCSVTNPPAYEIEEFFSAAECRQLQLFMDKYNFDPLNDKPLHGRFEWERVEA